jgi:hypothetical protein
MEGGVLWRTDFSPPNSRWYRGGTVEGSKEAK